MNLSISKATHAQLKAMFALGNKLGMDTEDLRGVAYRIGGVESLKALSKREAGRMIEELKRRAGEPTESRSPNRATEPQRRMINALVRQMGWADQPERLRGWLRRYCGAEDIRFLTPEQAGKAIDGLKAMLAGGRAERKREVLDGAAEVGG